MRNSFIAMHATTVTCGRSTHFQASYQGRYSLLNMLHVSISPFQSMMYVNTPATYNQISIKSLSVSVEILGQCFP